MRPLSYATTIDSEGAKFWLQVLTETKNRGTEDMWNRAFDRWREQRAWRPWTRLVPRCKVDQRRKNPVRRHAEPWMPTHEGVRMATSSSVGDLGQRILDEQLSLVRRWGDLAEHVADDARRLASGDIDTVDFTRRVASGAIRETVHGLEAAARLSMGYYRFVAGLANPATGGAEERAPAEDAKTLADVE